jgi:hypothetical protein
MEMAAPVVADQLFVLRRKKLKPDPARNVKVGHPERPNKSRRVDLLA